MAGEDFAGSSDACRGAPGLIEVCLSSLFWGNEKRVVRVGDLQQARC
jgi:hypothetical protein